MKVSIVLAAGEGTRMRSDLAKVMHRVCGRPMLEHVLDASAKAGMDKNLVVVGHKKEDILEQISGENIVFVEQPMHDGAPYGTGFAVMQALPHIDDDCTVVVLCGDTPLVKHETLKGLMEHHEMNDNSATVLTTVMDDPTGYGRVIRKTDGSLLEIVEQRDASEEQKIIREINSGIYCFKASTLKEGLEEISNDNSQGEYYLTDVIGILNGRGHRVGVLEAKDHTEIMGVNSRVQLAEAESIMRKRINTLHMLNGVTIIDPERTYIEEGIEIGRDTVIYPGAVLQGRTVIGTNCQLLGGTRIRDSKIGSCVDIESSLIEESIVGDGTHIGPYAHLRPKSVLGERVKIGNFVEVKNANIADGSKASHLSYVGDADVGKDVNIGCGVVFVNYNGVSKSRSIVGDHAFVGSNSNLVAPVEVKEWGYIAAGSTITDDVGEGELSIARARQVNKEGWVEKKGFKKHK
jgi:bifunctional UDP-N-acetylglucosamine pyrophosphorylase/glucosamine-1-phosphate N-acetyltransferase